MYGYNLLIYFFTSHFIDLYIFLYIFFGTHTNQDVLPVQSINLKSKLILYPHKWLNQKGFDNFAVLALHLQT